MKRSGTVLLRNLRLDGGTQMRVRLDESAIEDFSERIKAGDKFPPADVFFDGEHQWLADGFHRYYGHERAGEKSMPFVLHEGTLRDAILFACRANAAHGIRRKNEDKRRAVETLLADDEWGKKSSRWISEQAGVSHEFVRKIKEALSTVDSGSRVLGSDGRSLPAHQPKRQQIVRHEGDDWEPDEYEPESVPISSPSPKKSEPNVIGGLKERYDEFIAELLAGHPPHICIAMGEHFEMSGRLIKESAA